MLSRSGMDATSIQSTSASRPIRPAASWPTTVENVLLMSPSQILARQLGDVSHIRRLVLTHPDPSSFARNTSDQAMINPDLAAKLPPLRVQVRECLPLHFKQKAHGVSVRAMAHKRRGALDPSGSFLDSLRESP